MKYQTPNFKVGMGLHPSHFSYLEQQPSTDVAWFEATSEDYMSPSSHNMQLLKKIRQDYPVALHGCHLNIGSPTGPDAHYIKELRELIERSEPFLVSDHLCWTGGEQQSLHGLFPLPLNEESLRIVSQNIDTVQSQLKTNIALENIATYIDYAESEATEAEFISELCRRTGCNLVLDLGAHYVNAANHGHCPFKQLKNLPLSHVVQLHLSGPTETENYWLDKKASDVPSAIWDLLKYLAPQVRHLPIAIERQRNVPAFSDLEMEVIKASYLLENSHENERSAAFI
ncbi:DUF692 domain-containing protein [Bdellovibrio sp. HCB209]|uniref:DUF692 domain-containing protein n=1 Tax=Bdellovibrio sp. HCB209 TaxID=3394354 RepID=UPI0039B36E25